MKDPRRFARALRGAGLPFNRWVGGRQVHGVRVLGARRPSAPRERAATDGIWTDRPGLALRVFTADCVPVFLVRPEGGAVALLHAGWRGVANGILERGVAALGGKAAVTLGPHIRPCCYEVGPDVASAFRAARGAVRPRAGRPGKFTLDLAAALRVQARRAGVRRFSTAPWCTACDRRFHSFRRDRTERRQAAVTAINERSLTHGQASRKTSPRRR